MAILDNLRADVRNLGLTALLAPGVMTASGSRLDIFAKNIGQTRVMDNGEFPHVFTGFETMFSDYTFDSTKRNNPVKVIAIVDKYAMKVASIRAGSNPSRTVIYRDLETGEVSYFDIRRFTHFTNDYGYENIMRSNIQVNDIIDPDIEFYSSPAKDGNIYKLGINANVAFVTMLETTEDCFGISASLAERMSPRGLEMKSISIDMKKYPLNIHGDEETYKFIPDIGDSVGADGILCAFRPIKKFSAISDLQPDKLNRINHLFDKKVYAHPGSKVVDIEVHMDSRCALPSRIYEQVKVYAEARLSYWKTIIDVYNSVASLPISNKFNTLVTRAMGFVMAAKQTVPGIQKRTKVLLLDKYNPINLKIDIMLSHQVTVNRGHKTSGREGGKGVVIVKPDNEMPIDDQGFRADIVIDPVSVLKRTNIIQLYEQYINRVCKWFAMNLDRLGNSEQQFAGIVELLNDINPEYAKLISEEHPTELLRARFAEHCKNDTINVCIPPGMNNLTKDMVRLLRNKYQTPISPIEFIIDTSTGKKKIRTKTSVPIGSKYIYLLSKYPKPMAPGYGYVNTCHMPVSCRDKNEVPISTTPIRFGESESRIFATTVDISTVLRLKNLFSGARSGPRLMINALMAESHPSQLKRVDVSSEALYDDNPSIRIAHHLFCTAGIELQESLISTDEAAKHFDSVSKL